MVPYSMQHFITPWLPSLLLPYLQRSGHARCVVCRHNRFTILHHYKQRHILSCILLCSLEIATTHYWSSFNWYIAVVVTIMHKLTPRVMLWLTCTNILWEYVVTNIVVVIDVVCIVVVDVMSLHSRPTSAIWHSRHEGITNRCSGPN